MMAEFVNGTPKPRGKWVRSMGTRWWEGPCQCGSGREGHEVYDDHGILFGISCSKCKREPTPGYMHEEQIEPDDPSDLW
jgi:hypothetical protein